MNEVHVREGKGEREREVLVIEGEGGRERETER